MNPISPSERYKVIPRTLIFLFNNNKVLLIKQNEKEKIGFGRWNGVGGHVEKGENPIESAKRELVEETGLIIRKLSLRFITILEKEENIGISLFIFAGRTHQRILRESDEGKLKWIKVVDLEKYQVMDDLIELIELIQNPLFINQTKILTYKKNEKGQIQIEVVD
jgi:8-oxo-dGTP diphosphatase